MLAEDRFAPPPHIVVIGGGISGLAAALRLRDAGPEGIEITVIEQSGRVGGKLRTGRVAGVPIEDGAESFLLRVPEGRALAERVGLGHDLVSPTAGGAAVWVRGRLRPLPAGTVLGVPADLESVAASGVLSDEGLATVRAEPGRAGRTLAPGEDVAVGALVAERLGEEVLDRLVEPLLGGVYAGQAGHLSLRTTMPALAAGLAARPSLVEAARAAAAAGAGRPKTPVFATLRGGLSRLVTAVAHESGAAIRTGLPVRELHRTADGWQLVVGSTRNPSTVRADAVVLAVPATPAARLLAGVSAEAAGVVGALEYASVGLVSLVLPGALPLPPGTGALVAAGSGKLVKAITYISQKWGHVLDGHPGDPVTVVRASVGRHGAEQALQLDDASLVATVLDELNTLVPLPGGWPVPLGVKVNRWGGALPQYTPGHLERVASTRAALAGEPTLALAGAAYDGVGIPVCIRSGQAAADQVLAAVSKLEQGEPIHG